jgi:hypothetical protein
MFREAPLSARIRLSRLGCSKEDWEKLTMTGENRIMIYGPKDDGELL